MSKEEKQKAQWKAELRTLEDAYSELITVFQTTTHYAVRKCLSASIYELNEAIYNLNQALKP